MYMMSKYTTVLYNIINTSACQLDYMKTEIQNKKTTTKKQSKKNQTNITYVQMSMMK